MNSRFVPLCTVWQQQVKEFFTRLGSHTCNVGPSTSVGARAVEWTWSAAFIAFMVARVLFPWLPSWRTTIPSPPTGDPKGPPIHPSSILAPTDVDELALGLRRIGRPLLLPSFSPPHKKNDQKHSRGARLTTRQTIASPTPVHIKIGSPISKKILSRNRTHFPKNLSHLDLNRLVPPIMLKERTRLQM